MKQHNRNNKVCKGAIKHLEPQTPKSQVSVFWKATKSRKGFSETLRGTHA